MRANHNWHNALHTWLEGRGLALVACSVKGSGGDVFLNGIRGYAIASGPSPYSPGVWHATVMKDGRVVHYPMGGSAIPLPSIEEVEFLRPLDPSLIQRHRAMVEAMKSHVDGRDLLYELNPNGAHFINIRVRINGQFKEYEGDWLKRLMWARDGHNRGARAALHLVGSATGPIDGSLTKAPE